MMQYPPRTTMPLLTLVTLLTATGLLGACGGGGSSSSSPESSSTTVQPSTPVASSVQVADGAASAASAAASGASAVTAAATAATAAAGAKTTTAATGGKPATAAGGDAGKTGTGNNAVVGGSIGGTGSATGANTGANTGTNAVAATGGDPAAAAAAVDDKNARATGQALANVLVGTGIKALNYAGCTPKTTTDFLDKLLGHQRRLMPRDCKAVETTSPLFSWGETSDRAPDSSWIFTLKNSAGETIASKAVTVPRVSLGAQTLAVGAYTWSVSYTSKAGPVVRSDARNFSVPAGTAANTIPEGSVVASRAAAKARPRIVPTGSSFTSIFAQALAGESAPILAAQTVRARQASATTVPAAPANLAKASYASDLAYTQDLLAWMNTAETERNYIEALALEGYMRNIPAYRILAAVRLKALATWSPSGLTGEAVNDQGNRSVYLALAQGLDLLWNDLTPAERTLITTNLRTRILEAAAKVDTLNKEPYDSHVIGNVQVLTQALLFAAGLPEFPEANGLLAKMWDLGRFSVNSWGDDDGSFGNGVAYGWYSFLRLPRFMAAARIVAGVDLSQVPYLKRAGDQLLAFTAPNKIGPSAFGDETETSNLYDLYARDAYRLYALLTRSAQHEWYWRQKPTNVTAPPYLEPWHLMLLPIVGARTAAAAPASNSAFFFDAGIAAMHKDASKVDRTSLFFRSSRFGAYNHSHADQNSFVFFSGGQPLLINAGYYPYYGSPHHTKVTRATRYKNALTFDGGIGQSESAPAPATPTAPYHSMDASGNLVNATDNGDVAVATGDATLAYRAVNNYGVWTPLLSNAVRSVAYLRSAGVVIIYDWATSNAARKWELNFHAPAAFAVAGTTITSKNGTASACLNVYGPPTTFAQTTAWDVAPEKTVPAQAHGRFTAQTASTELVSVTVIRDACAGNAAQVAFNGTTATVTVAGRAYGFDKRVVSLPLAQ